MRRIQSVFLQRNVLKTARTAAGLDQEDLAARAGISPETISRIERLSAKRIYDVVDTAIQQALRQVGVTVLQGADGALHIEIRRGEQRLVAKS